MGSIPEVVPNAPMRPMLFVQYSWKYVTWDKDGICRKVLSSDRLFHKRNNCILEGMKHRKRVAELAGNTGKFKLIVVRKKRSLVTVDEVEERSCRNSGDNMLTLIYADHVRKELNSLITLKCDACEIDDPSQLHHTCLMFTYEELLEMYFQDALDSVNDEQVFEEWKSFLKLSGLMEKIHPIYLLKYNCKEWLDNKFKTEAWKEELKRMVLKMHELEPKFSLTQLID